MIRTLGVASLLALALAIIPGAFRPKAESADRPGLLSEKVARLRWRLLGTPSADGASLVLPLPSTEENAAASEDAVMDESSDWVVVVTDEPSVETSAPTSSRRRYHPAVIDGPQGADADQPYLLSVPGLIPDIERPGSIVGTTPDADPATTPFTAPPAQTGPQSLGRQESTVPLGGEPSFGGPVQRPLPELSTMDDTPPVAGDDAAKRHAAGPVASSLGDLAPSGETAESDSPVAVPAARTQPVPTVVRTAPSSGVGRGSSLVTRMRMLQTERSPDAIPTADHTAAAPIDSENDDSSLPHVKASEIVRSEQTTAAPPAPEVVRSQVTSDSGDHQSSIVSRLRSLRQHPLRPTDSEPAAANRPVHLGTHAHDKRGTTARVAGPSPPVKNDRATGRAASPRRTAPDSPSSIARRPAQSASPGDATMGRAPLASKTRPEQIPRFLSSRAIPRETETPEASHPTRSQEAITTTPARRREPAPLRNEAPDADRREKLATRPAAPHPSRAVQRPQAASPSTDVLVRGSSDASIEVQTLGPREIVIGEESLHQVTLRNSGSKVVSGITASIRVPSWGEVVKVSPTAGDARRARPSSGQSQIEWQLPDLKASATAELFLNIRAKESRPIALAIRWTAADTPRQLTPRKVPQLGLALSGPSQIVFGHRQVYRLRISNPGTGPTRNVVVTLVPNRPGGKAPQFRVGEISAGSSRTLELEVTPRDAGQLAMKVEATADGGLRASASEKIQVMKPQLAIDITGPESQSADGVVGYAIQVRNEGDAPTRNITVTALLPPNAEVISVTGGASVDPREGKLLWYLSKLHPGGQDTFTLRCTLNAPGDNEVRVFASGDDDTEDVDTVITRVDVRPDVKLKVIGPSQSLLVGEDADYEIRLSNRGTDKANEIDVVVFFSEGVEPVAARGFGHSVHTGQVVFETIPGIAAGEEIVLRVTAQAQIPGNHVIRVEAFGHDGEVDLMSEQQKLFNDRGTVYRGRSLRP